MAVSRNPGEPADPALFYIPFIFCFCFFFLLKFNLSWYSRQAIDIYLVAFKKLIVEKQVLAKKEKTHCEKKMVAVRIRSFVKLFGYVDLSLHKLYTFKGIRADKLIRYNVSSHNMGLLPSSIGWTYNLSYDQSQGVSYMLEVLAHIL